MSLRLQELDMKGFIQVILHTLPDKTITVLSSRQVFDDSIS